MNCIPVTFSLANTLSLCVLTLVATNTIWMSVLVYREGKSLAYMRENVEQGLRRLKSHCRIIGCSVIAICLLGIGITADLLTSVSDHKDGGRRADVGRNETMYVAGR